MEIPSEHTQSDRPAFVRKSVLAERHDLAWAWALAAIVGAVAISLVPEQYPLARMLGPIAIMLGYLSVAVTRSKFSTTKVADSVYFMGFLWTLWALIDLLVIGNRQLTAGALYIAFGYALTATAAGMFFRLTLLQFFRTVDEQEEQAVDAIDDRVKRLVAELERSQAAVRELQALGAKELQRWHAEYHTAASNHLESIKQTTAAYQLAGAELADAVKDVRKAVSASGKLFVDLEKRLGAASKGITERLDEGVSALQSGMRDLAARIASVSVSPEAIVKPIADAASDVRAAIGPLGIAAENAVADFRRHVDEVGKALKELPKAADLQSAADATTVALGAASNACNALAAAAGSAADSFDTVRQEAEQAKKSAQEIGSTMQRHLSDTTNAVRAIRASLDELNGDVGKAGEALTEVVQFVQAQIPRV